jgi:DNA modification methylase
MSRKDQQHSQQALFDSEGPETRDSKPVTCFGMTFGNDEARRGHFLGLLREGLEDLHARLGGVPFTTVEDAVELMKSVGRAESTSEGETAQKVRFKWPMGDEVHLRELAERMRHADSQKDLLQRWKDEVGFPHGEIEDILNLSDPPYYTACPNPFIADFIKYYGKSYDPETDDYRREPFAADVSEGKNDPIYNAHSYHTKVPHKAIMRYILHYTEPGDVVFDGFCGTGMTGVAAQLCGKRATVETLGYKVDENGIIYQQSYDENDKTVWKPFSKLGARQAVLNDLSPAATFIAYNYNTPVDVVVFEREAKRILKEVEDECGWMYETIHTDGMTKGRINYTVWSDVFICPECTGEVVFWEAAVDKEAGMVHSEFPCPHCNATLTKRNMDRAWVIQYDRAISQTVRQAKQVPVLISYSVGKKRFEKTPDAFDLALIEKIEQLDIPYWFPIDAIPKGDKTGEPLRIGITHVHHFYTKRNLWVLAAFAQRSRTCSITNFLVSGIVNRSTLMNRIHLKNYFFGGGGWNAGYMKGTLYISSLPIETSILEQIDDRLLSYISAFNKRGPIARHVILYCQTSSVLDIKENSVDYLFVDPPFGANIMYSELNLLWEAWLKVFTNNMPEAIENNVQGKSLLEYQLLMIDCFKEYCRVLKPGRWMTVEFHNSKNSVWNAIQEALQTAGFVIADVRTLDKKQGSFNQVTQAGAVKQDIIISAYKPNGGLEERFKLAFGSEDGAWDFVRAHLRQLPVFVSKDARAEVIAERLDYLLFDRMVAFHVQRGVTVPLSAGEFYAGLAQRFPERDGMYFLPEQVAEYDKKRMKVKEVLQLQLFVIDEASAIQWLKQQLLKKPQTFQEIHPQFLKEIGGWQKHEKPLELSELLEQNFLRYGSKGEVPSQIHSYLSSNFKDLRNLAKDDERLRAKAKDRWYVPDPNKASDLEKLRERALLREFHEYRESKQKRLKVFRLEAVRAGFKKAWQERDYPTIIAVARKIPENVLQEDPKLLMWYDQALTRMG